MYSAAQEFMDAMAITGLSQQIMVPLCVVGYTLDLVFTGGYGEGDLRMEETKFISLSWTDRYLVRFMTGNT